jgi:hypothetical protein
MNISSGAYVPGVWAGSQFSPKLLPSSVKPLSAHVKLTENCQARCVSCDYWKTRWKDGIDTSRAIALVNEIEERGIGGRVYDPARMSWLYVRHRVFTRHEKRYFECFLRNQMTGAWASGPQPWMTPIRRSLAKTPPFTISLPEPPMSITRHPGLAK